jgi:hypothetical protein
MSHFDTLTGVDTLIFCQTPGLKPTNNDTGGKDPACQSIRETRKRHTPYLNS